MWKAATYLVAGCLVLLIMASYSPATMRPGLPGKTFTGKLIAITTTKGRYKLTIDERSMFIIDNDLPRNQFLIKTAKALKNRIVTVTYTQPGNIILTIRPRKKKNHF